MHTHLPSQQYNIHIHVIQYHYIPHTINFNTCTDLFQGGGGGGGMVYVIISAKNTVYHRCTHTCYNLCGCQKSVRVLHVYSQVKLKMPVNCCAYGCTKRFAKGRDTKFFRFSKNLEQRRRWVLTIRRQAWSPTDYTRIYSNHLSMVKFPSMLSYGKCWGNPIPIVPVSVARVP